MKKTTLFLMCGLLALSPAAYSQQGENGSGDGGGSDDKSSENSSNATEEDGVQRFWQVTLDGGDFVTALDRIVSISKSEYLLDGNLVVNEVTIDSGGRSLARFYHITPVSEIAGQGKNTAAHAITRLQGVADRAGDKSGTDVHNMAQKSYPTTTHTGMIEYRILDIRDLDAIYKSVRTAWQTGRAKKLTIK